MAVLDKIITYSDAVRRGALEVMSEPVLRRISGGADAMRIGDILHLPLNPKLLTCVIMHEEVLSPGAMRRAAAAIARDVVERLDSQRTYIDFRVNRALEAAVAFANGDRSLGELATARVRAETAREDVMELQDENAMRAASIAEAVCDPDPREAAMRSMNVAVDIFNSDEDQRRYAGVLERHLQGEES